MQNQDVSVLATQAYLELISLNMRLWRPEVEDWLHSDDAREPLRQLLSAVPCPPVLH